MAAVPAKTLANESGSELSGFNGIDILVGAAGDDELNGVGGDDELYGYGGSDELLGGDGDDFLDGGAGDDTLKGESGNDVYWLDYGSGHDRIEHSDSAGASAYTDTLRFGPGITIDDITLVKQGGDLIVRLGDGSNSVTFWRWFNHSYYYQIDHFEFDDLLITETALLDEVLVYSEANAEGSVLEGYGGNDYFLGAEGPDELNGNSGNDELYGYGGSDELLGGDGDDFLDGGAGNDTLKGESGNDVYWLDYGSGHDRIEHSDSGGASAYTDTLRFGPGITIDDITLVKQGGDLIVRLGDGSNSVTFWRWFNHSYYYQIDHFEFDDQFLTSSDLISQLGVLTELVGNAAVGTDQRDRLIAGSTRGYTLSAEDGDDELVSGLYDDILLGGAGNDDYYWSANEGNDVIWDDGELDAADTSHQDRLIIEGIDVDDLSFNYHGLDLVITIGSTGNTLTIEDWYLSDDYKVEQIIVDGIAIDLDLNVPVIELLPDDLDLGSLTGGLIAEILSGLQGSDTLDGGAGDDVLAGGAGDDTYIWGEGYGHDQIDNFDTQGFDKLEFDASISEAGLVWDNRDYDLVFTWLATGETLTIVNWFKGEAYNLSEIYVSSESSELDISLLEMSITTLTDDADIGQLDGSLLNEIFLGLAGDDVLQGFEGDDELHGGDGNDTLDAGEGNDLLWGDADNDDLYGGPGNDAYHWGAEAGNDTIYDHNTVDAQNASHVDTLVLLEGTSPDDLAWVREGVDLVATHALGNTLVINDWFVAPEYRLTSFTDNEGIELDIAAIELIAITRNAPETGGTVSGTNANDVLQGSAANDTLSGGNGDDVLDGG
ncbi:calcium-binding protein, partial [Marinagarivorans algicola]|uniref:calcium-binding protein n=1 Tax=Marinagarivorans algicola TaxID=1513270 RepID=UPI002368DD93